MGIDYIEYEQALKIYEKTVEKSGGGMAGVWHTTDVGECAERLVLSRNC